MKNYTAVILASGQGKRMNSAIPKQFHRIGTSTLLEIVLNKFSQSGLFSALIISCLPGFETRVSGMAGRSVKSIPCQVVTGGETRFMSVLSALRAMSDSTYVLIHDVVRPCFSNHLLNRLCKALQEQPAVIPVLSSTDSLYQRKEKRILCLDKKSVVRVQTPQGFDAALLKTSYLKAVSENQTDFQDDFSVWIRYSGQSYQFIEGEQKNIKITYPGDIDLAAFYLKQ